MSRFTPSEAGKGGERRDGVGYEDNYEATFGKKEPLKRGSYIQDPKTGKLVLRSEYVSPETGRYASVHSDIAAFISPIDGSVIDDRGKLREHNRKHGVTNAADYSPEYLQKRRDAKNISPQQAKSERLDAIRKSRYLHGYHD